MLSQAGNATLRFRPVRGFVLIVAVTIGFVFHVRGELVFQFHRRGW